MPQHYDPSRMREVILIYALLRLLTLSFSRNNRDVYVQPQCPNGLGVLPAMKFLSSIQPSQNLLVPQRHSFGSHQRHPLARHG